ncbi:hypothetical protein [Pseudomonas sp. TMB3-21]
MNEKLREEFEAWAMTSAYLGLSDTCMARFEDGYLGGEVHAAWIAWQASRAALVIELPSDTCIKVNNYTPFEMRDFFERSARRLGLQVTT